MAKGVMPLRLTDRGQENGIMVQTTTADAAASASTSPCRGREAPAGCGGDTGAYDAHGPALQQAGVAQRPDHRRRRIDVPQALRKRRLAGGEQHRAHGPAGGKLGFGVRDPESSKQPAQAAAKPYAGIQLLTGPANYFAIDNDPAVSGTPFGLYDGFTDSEKFTSISTQRLTAGLSTGNGGDVSLAELVHKGLITADEGILHVEDQVEFLKVLGKTAPQAEQPTDQEEEADG